MNLLEVLEVINVNNTDDGFVFQDCRKLDKIDELLWNSKYRRINHQGLFHLYAKKTMNQLDYNVILVSCHVDQSDEVKEIIYHNDGQLIHVNLESSITTSAILKLMLDDELEDYVIVAFVGDSIYGHKGAYDVCDYLKQFNKNIVCSVVLNVSNDQYDCDITIENMVVEDDTCAIIKDNFNQMMYVPYDYDYMNEMIEDYQISDHEAKEDDSWIYIDASIECFTLCISCVGKFYRNEGIYVKEEALNKYYEGLKKILNKL